MNEAKAIVLFGLGLLGGFLLNTPKGKEFAKQTASFIVKQSGIMNDVVVKTFVDAMKNTTSEENNGEESKGSS